MTAMAGQGLRSLYTKTKITLEASAVPRALAVVPWPQNGGLRGTRTISAEGCLTGLHQCSIVLRKGVSKA